MVDYVISQSILSKHPILSISVSFHCFNCMPFILRQKLIQALFHMLYLLCLNWYIRRLSLCTSQHLMNHNLAIFKSISLTFLPADSKKAPILNYYTLMPLFCQRHKVPKFNILCNKNASQFVRRILLYCRIKHKSQIEIKTFLFKFRFHFFIMLFKPIQFC